MASIVYAVCGEGRGHATRARALVEALRAEHEITLFASQFAYELLSRRYAGTEVKVVELPGLGFAYRASGKVALFGTLANVARFRLDLDRFVEAALRPFERARPDVVLVDFEPVMPRVAERCGVPFVSFDHQHYLVVSDFSDLPTGIRRQAALAAPFVKAMFQGQADTVVSSFYRAPLKPAYRDTTWVGALIRPEIVRARSERGNYLVAYMRRHASAEDLEVLARCGRPVRLYGLGERAPRGQIRFFAVDERRFLDDLASCEAVVTTAGNQLVGEALTLRKPVLALPEPWNFEQAVNAHFLQAMGVGWAEWQGLTPARLGAFLEATSLLRTRIHPEDVCGNEAALTALSRHLRGSARTRQLRPTHVDRRVPVEGTAS